MAEERVEEAQGALDGTGAPWAGAPLASTLAFLAAPALLLVATQALDLPIPPAALYGLAGGLGLVLLARTFADPEWLLAVFVAYVPFSKKVVGPIAPGVNGTNVLLAALLAAWVVHAVRAGRPLFAALPNARLVGLWCAATLLSVATAGWDIGFAEVLATHGLDLKGWIDHIVVFFAFLYLIRDGAMARRVVLYMMVCSVLILGLGVQEWLDKRWLDSIDKARLLGPQLQPNDFGAFLVYIAGPFLGLLLLQLRRVRAVALLVPYFLVLAKILLATFSRGAFIGMAVAGVVAGYVRGRAFLLAMALLGAGLVLAMPQLVPESLAHRMSTTVSDSGYDTELDASSMTRVVLWRAAVDMSLESPLLGKGFKSFPRLKGRYTEFDVEEGDNHNMFLYISSQMGIPTLLVFLWILYRAYDQGRRVHARARDTFGRAIGMGAAAMVGGVVAVNMFGSRMVDIAVTAYVWIYLAALAHLVLEVDEDPAAAAAPGVAA